MAFPPDHNQEFRPEPFSFGEKQTDFPITKMRLVASLRAAWLAGTLPVLLASTHFNFFPEWLFGFAKRGTISNSSSNKFTVPLKFNSHVYALAVAWTTFLLITTWFYAYQEASFLVSQPSYSAILNYLTGNSNTFSFLKSHRSMVKHGYEVRQSILLLLLMEIQAVRRLIESIYGLGYRPSYRMHILVYLSGMLLSSATAYNLLFLEHLFQIFKFMLAAYTWCICYQIFTNFGDAIRFYTAAPLSLCSTVAPEVFKFAENMATEFIVKGKGQTPASSFDWWVFVSSLVKLRWYSWVGVAIFLWAWYQQLHVLAINDLLSKYSTRAYGSYDDWFEFVLSLHYPTEIVIYASFVVASGGADLTIWLLFGFMVANLAAYRSKNTEVVRS